MLIVRVDDDGGISGDGDALELPGFVNAHSHAFQRALRGRVETRSADHPNDSFWSWRTTMYGDAARLDVDDVYALACWAYADMLRAGFTAVGEFHYLHNDESGAPYARPEMSLALARAAEAVGIRLVLLETAYARGGPDTALAPAQRRFAFPTVDAFLAHVERSRAACASVVGRAATVTPGVALHSVRACPRDWIEAVARYAEEDGLPLHVHACEQRAEIAACRAEHGVGPIALLDACGALGPRTTVVHATHIDDDDVALLAARGALVCLTPSTERNLGDGLCPIASLRAAGVRLCVGTDSHARIDVVDELRSLEDHERLRTERRNVLVEPGARLAQALLPAGTRDGRAALGLDGQSADRVVVAMPLEGQAGDAAAGLDAWLVGGSSASVRDVFVDGRPVVQRGALVAGEAAVEAAARAVLTKLRGR